MAPSASNPPKFPDQTYWEFFEWYMTRSYTHYGKLKVDEFITHRKTLGEINNAFETMKDGDCIRAVVDMKKL